MVSNKLPFGKKRTFSFFEIFLSMFLFSLTFENNLMEYDRYKLLTLLIVFINSKYVNNRCKYFLTKQVDIIWYNF